MTITRKLKFYSPNKAKEAELNRFLNVQTECVNFWIEKIRETKSTKVGELQKSFYKEARQEYGMGSLMTQLAMFVAIRLARVSKRRRVITPFLKNKLIAVSNLRIDKNNLGITFGNGYFWIPFKSQEIPEGKIKESKIKKIGNNWYCYLSVEIKEPKIKEYKRYLGVDLGLAKIAVVSDTKGRARFFRGEQVRNIRQHYHKLRQELQPKIKQGNVYKLLKRIDKKESNWMRDTNHKISRKIVEMARKQKKNIALENLTGITSKLKGNKQTRRMLMGWSFRQLTDFIKYKARLIGLEVSSIDPRETSRRCPKCGYVSHLNRKSQERFICRKCNYESNADRIGAMNVAIRATELMASPLVYGQRAIAQI